MENAVFPERTEISLGINKGEEKWWDKNITLGSLIVWVLNACYLEYEVFMWSTLEKILVMYW